MKLTRVVFFAAVAALILTGATFSQTYFAPGEADTMFECDYYDQYSPDSIAIVQTAGLPGTQISVPLWMLNNDTVAAMQVYLEFDSTLIKPVITSVDTTIDTTLHIDTIIVYDPPDTTYDTTYSVDTFVVNDYQYTLTSRFINQGLNRYSVRVVDESDFPSSDPNRQRINVLVYPIDFIQLAPAIDTGVGDIMRLDFTISSSATLGSQTTINFYRETIYNDSIPPERVGCIFSQYYDTTGSPIHRLQERSGNILFTEPPDVPVINYFYAQPNNIISGEPATLYWSVSNATSVTISPSVGTVGDSGQTVVYPTATTTYTLTATNSEGSAALGATVVVSEPGSNNRPVFTQPTQTSYEIDQGQTVSFVVTATDADGDTLSLSPSSLPNNATFGPTNPVIGVGSVTGNFSFTPDYSQVGTFQVTFVADDGKAGGSQQLVVTIVVNELQYDRLFTTSAEGQAPEGGQPGTRGVLVPINLVTSQTVYGVQFDFFYDAEYFTVDSFITTPRTENYVIYDNIGATPGEIRVVTFGVANEPVQTDTASTAILYAVMSIDTSAVPGDYPLRIENGWESVNPDPNFPSLPLVTDSGIIQVDRLGDVNLDRRVDVADAVNVVGYILGNYTFTQRQFDAGDVTKDTLINVFDLVGIINLIYGIPPSPVAGQFIDAELATVSLDYSNLYRGETDILIVKSELPEQIAGVQLEIRYDPSSVSLGTPSLGEGAQKMVLSARDDKNGKLTTLLYFKNPFRSEDLIQVGQAELLNIPVTAKKDIVAGDETRMKLTQALLSTPTAQGVRVEGMDVQLPSTFVLQQNYPNPFNPTTTIEFSLGGTSEGALTQHVNLDIYNILGQHVKTLVDRDLVPGNYKVEWDATDNGGKRVASGIYLYKLQVDRESKSKKMLFLK